MTSPARTLRLLPPLPWTELAQRRARGRALRKRLPRLDQGKWEPDRRRHDPLAILARAERGHLPALLPIKHGRMAVSPFTFFRGAVPVMAADLGTLPMTGLAVQICGDAHVRNLGAFAAPDGHLVFDINDFDETTRAPWEWDLKRLATSFVLAGREAGVRDRACLDAVGALAWSYSSGLRRFAEMPLLELLRYEIRRHTESGPVHVALHKAERVTPQDVLAKLTVRGRGGVRRFASRPPALVRVSSSIARQVRHGLVRYRTSLSPERQLILDAYRPVDVAFKVVGTGSVGSRDYAVLAFGGGPHDPLVLQVKEEFRSAWAPYVGDDGTHAGWRVATG